jgi:hypothetical protein
LNESRDGNALSAASSATAHLGIGGMLTNSASLMTPTAAVVLAAPDMFDPCCRHHFPTLLDFIRLSPDSNCRKLLGIA